MVKKSNQVRKAGQEYVHANGRGKHSQFTAKSFFGESGIEYSTAAKARGANSQGNILVKNEYGGATDICLSKYKRKP